MRMATDLHGGLVQRQPPPRRFHIYRLSPRIFAAHASTRTNHGTFQPCAGTSVASVHLYKAGASQYINYFVLPLSYSAQERPLPQAYAPCGCEARCHAYGADGWVRTNDGNQRRERCVLYRLSYVCIEGGVPRHIPLWRRGGSLVLLWRWVTPFSRQPRRFSRCPKWAGLGGGPLCHVTILAREPQRAAWRYRWGSDPRPAHYE